MVDDNNVSDKQESKIPGSSDKDQLWIARISRREKALRDASDRNHWERYIREYQGDFSEVLGTASGRVLPLNLIYAYVRSEIPALYVQDPHLEFTPKNDTTIGAAKLKEIATNDIWHRKKFKREIKKVIQDGKIVGHGWLKIGYKADIGLIEENDHNLEFVTNEDYFLYRVNWRHVIFSDESVDVPYDTSWIAHKFYVPLDEAKNNPNYGENRSNLVGVKLSGNEELSKQNYKNEFTVSDVEYAELYEVWDKKSQKVLIVSTNNKVGILQERPWPYTKMSGFPFLFLNLSFVNDMPYGISDVGMGERHVLEKTKIRTAFLEHIKRGNRMLLTKTNNFSPEAKDAYRNGDDSALLEVEDPNAVSPIPYAPFQSDVYALESRLDDDLTQIWGQKPSDRAGQARTQTRTKFELQNQNVGTIERRSEQIALIQDMVEEAAEKFSCLLEQYATEPFYVRLTGYDPAQIAEMLAKRPSAVQPGAVTTGYGFTVTGEDIKGPVDVRVKEGTAIPLDRQSKIQLLERLAQLAPTAGAIPGGPFLGALGRMIVEEAGMHELTKALDQELAAQQQLKAEQQAAMTEQAQMAAGTEATKLQLQAETIATQKQKNQSDAMLELLGLIKDIQMEMRAMREEQGAKDAEPM